MNFIDARLKLKNFVEARLNHDTLCNFVFWLGMTCWVTFSMPENPMVALSSLIGMPFLIKKLFPLKVVAQRPELILEYPDSSSFAPNSQEKVEKKELPEARECLANSEGKIVSDGAPYLFFALLSPFAIGVPLLLILEKGLELNFNSASIFFGTWFLIPTAIFELCDRPISLLFDSRAWYLQGWRRIRRGSFSNSSSDLFANSSSRSSDWYYSSSYSAFSGNIHNHRR